MKSPDEVFDSEVSIFDKEVLDDADIHVIVEKILAFTRLLTNCELFEYQREFAYGVCFSVISGKADTITALFARQSGKSQTLSVVVCGLGILIPKLAQLFKAKQFRRFDKGFMVGVYGPDYDKASIIWGRVREFLSTPEAKRILQDPDLGLDSKEAQKMQFSNGFKMDLRTANKDAKLEGHSYHLIIIDEAQDVSSTVITKSIRPMRSFYAGTIVYIGTPCPARCEFSEACFANRNADRAANIQRRRHRSHYEFDYKYCSKYNESYKLSVEEDKRRLGEFSDSFRMAYKLEWLDTKGKFIPQSDVVECGIVKTDYVTETVDRRGTAKQLTFTRSEACLSDLKQPPDGTKIVFSIDYGGKDDSTVLTIAQAFYGGPTYLGTIPRYYIHILDWLELKGDSHEKQFPQILAKLDNYDVSMGINDATGLGDPLHSRLKAVLSKKDILVHPFIFSLKSKHEGYTLLSQEIAAKRLTFPYSPRSQSNKGIMGYVTQTGDLLKTYPESTGGAKFPKYAAPDIPGAHDDYPSSVMMLCWLVNEISPPYLHVSKLPDFKEATRATRAKEAYLKRLEQDKSRTALKHLLPSTPTTSLLKRLRNA